MVTWGREWIAGYGDHLIPATLTFVDAGVWRDRPWGVGRVEFRVGKAI